MEIAFRVHGHGRELYGDGFALWYVKDPPRGGPVFGNRDYFTGLAIVLDTYANQKSTTYYSHPKISVMVNNGTLHYDHEADGIESELAACECKFRGSDHEVRILVQYYNEQLTVKTDIENDGLWRDCVAVRGVYLPSHYHFGITAATGDLSDNHDIISIKMRQLSPQSQITDDLPRADYSTLDRHKIVPVDDPPRPDNMSSLRRLFILVCVFAGVVSVAGFGYFLYKSRKGSSRKRFY